MKMKEEEHLAHYGILRRSGRYPWGSGGTVAQRSRSFLDTIESLKAQGMSDPEIAKGFSSKEHPFTTNDLRAQKSIAVNEIRQQKINQVRRLRDEKGMSMSAIGRKMGLNESSVRALYAPAAKDKVDILKATSDMLRRQVDEKGAIDIGTQVERSLPISENPAQLIGISPDKFRTAVAVLKSEGYKVHRVDVEQIGTGKFTTNKVLARPDVQWKDLVRDPALIKPISESSEDGGRTYDPLGPLVSASSKRLQVRYAKEGGAEADGVIYLRRGAKDLDLGASRYAQVRIPIDGTHYIKGMAIYKDDLPAGVDMVFNTNKSNTGNKLDALKEMERTKDGRVDEDNPFGAVIKPGGRKGALNKVYEEGDWDNWKRVLPSQMLSKQKPELIKDQLAFTTERRRNEFEQIKQLTNPTVRKKLLETFADKTDASAVNLEAANMPRQSTKVLLPVPSVKAHEIYAPSFRNGERVALVRFPHGGTFEIPELTVNNRNPEAQKLLGKAPSALDAVGINHKVAERLSGADFDGDTVVVIPNNRGSVKSTPPLDRLKGFDPKAAYPPYDGMRTVDGGKWDEKTQRVSFKNADGTTRRPTTYMQKQMGDISNLITDMTIQGAPTTEMARAVRHSMVVIDSEKHHLDYKSSARDHGIADLKEKYQGGKRAGASTLLSRATAETRLPKRKPRLAKDGGPIDRATGKKVFVETGEGFTNAKGQRVVLKEVHDQLAVTDDAHTLTSTPAHHVERLYANHSNRLKALANEARKEAVHTPNLKYSESANKVYKKQVESLDAKLNLALKNAPLERQAQRLANSTIAQKKAANPHMDKAEEKKVRNQALHESRARTGAGKTRIDLTPDEWAAIQAGAISNHKLTSILQNSNIDTVRALATPRRRVLMSSTMKSRAQGMISAGFTQAEIADALGVSLSTLKEGLK